jgi:hypothetical protein
VRTLFWLIHQVWKQGIYITYYVVGFGHHSQSPQDSETKNITQEILKREIPICDVILITTPRVVDYETLKLLVSYGAFREKYGKVTPIVTAYFEKENEQENEDKAFKQAIEEIMIDPSIFTDMDYFTKERVARSLKRDRVLFQRNLMQRDPAAIEERLEYIRQLVSRLDMERLVRTMSAFMAIVKRCLTPIHNISKLRLLWQRVIEQADKMDKLTQVYASLQEQVQLFTHFTHVVDFTICECI